MKTPKAPLATPGGSAAAIDEDQRKKTQGYFKSLMNKPLAGAGDAKKVGGAPLAPKAAQNSTPG
jgi:hypothetical protein